MRTTVSASAARAGRMARGSVIELFLGEWNLPRTGSFPVKSYSAGSSYSSRSDSLFI